MDERFTAGGRARERGPTAAPPAEHGPPLAPVAGSRELRPAAHPGSVVVVADPDEDTRRILGLALTHAGYTYRGASTGDEALALAPSAQVMIADLYVPCAAGPCIVAPITRGRRDGEPRVIVYTAFSTPRDRAWARASGCDALLLKPASLQVMLDTVARLEAMRAR